MLCRDICTDCPSGPLAPRFGEMLSSSKSVGSTLGPYTAVDAILGKKKSSFDFKCPAGVGKCVGIGALVVRGDGDAVGKAVNVTTGVGVGVTGGIVTGGSYVIDLNQTEELLWQNIDRITRQNIKSAQKNSVTVQRRIEPLDEAYRLIVETFRRSKLPFMGYEAFRRYADGLTGQMEIMIASCQGVAQSYVLFAFSNYCAYAVYAGNIADMCQGANKLLYWEAIRYFKKIGVQKYDFVGARINPEKGTKQSGINSLKKRFGAKLVQGYMWKYKIRPVKSLAYSIAVRLLRGGDIVDAECHKIESI